MQIRRTIGSTARYCLTKAEVQIVLDLVDTLEGEKITPITPDLQKYYRLILALKQLDKKWLT